MKRAVVLLTLVALCGFGYSLDITSPKGGFTRTKLFTFEVKDPPALMKMTFNGIPVFAKSQQGFTRDMLASRGWNTITVADAKNLLVNSTIGFYADVPPTSLKIYLFWDTDNTDLDLHVIEPDSIECYYGNKETPLGGRLDVDVTTGYGPEVYTMESPQKGEYQIFIHFYGGAELTEATAVAIQDEGTSKEKRTTFKMMLTQQGTKIYVGKLEIK